MRGRSGTVARMIWLVMRMASAWVDAASTPLGGTVKLIADFGDEQLKIA